MTYSGRLSDRMDHAISILIVVIWCALMLNRYWNSWPPDLSALYLAGKFYAAGQFDLIYATPEGFFGPLDPRWTDALAAMGYPDAATFPFIYPPLWAAIIAPFTYGAPSDFFNTAYVIQVSLLGIAILLAYRVIKPPISRTLWCVTSCALLLTSLISVNALYHNQFQIFVTFLIILALERYRTGQPALAGMLVAIAASVKLEPLALCLLFILNRDARALIAVMWTASAITALSWLIAGDLNLVYFLQLKEIASQIAVINVNFSLTSGLYQIFYPSEVIANHTVAHITWITSLIWGVFIGAVALIAKSDLHWSRQVVTIMIATTLCSPVAWPHHFLPALILLPSVFAFLRFNQAFALLTAFGALSSTAIFDVATHWLSFHHHASALLNMAILLASFAIFLVCPKTRA